MARVGRLAVLLVLVAPICVSLSAAAAVPVARVAQTPAWSWVKSPNPSASDNELTGVSAVSRANAWAVGLYGSAPGGGRTLVLHWDGAAWSRVASPNPRVSDNELADVSVAPGAGAWAVGYRFEGTETYDTLILRSSGTARSRR